MITSEEIKKPIQSSQEEQDNFEQNQIILTHTKPLRLQIVHASNQQHINEASLTRQICGYIV